MSGVERKDKTTLISNLRHIPLDVFHLKKNKYPQKINDCISFILSLDRIFIILICLLLVKNLCESLMCEVKPFSFIANDFASEESVKSCLNYHRLFLNTLLHSNDKYLCLQSLRRTCLHGQSSYIEKIEMITLLHLI